MHVHTPTALLLFGLLSCQGQVSDPDPDPDSDSDNGTDDTDTDTDAVNPAELADGVVLMDDLVDGGLVTVEEDRLLLPHGGSEQLLGLTPGSIVVSGHERGYLRTVDGVVREGGQLVITTTQATLTDAVMEGSFAQAFELGDGGARFPTGTLDFSGETLYSASNYTIRLKTGKVSFDPDVDIDFDISGGSLERFSVTGGGTLSSQLELEVISEAGSGLTLDGSTTLWETDWTFLTFVGVLPVVTVVTLKLDAGYTVSTSHHASLSGGVTVSRAVEMGFVLDNGEVTLIGDVSEGAAELIGPEVGLAATMGADVWVEPRLEFEFYGVAGPYLSARAGVQAEMSAWDSLCSLELDATFVATAGAEWDVFDMTASIDLPPLYEVSWPVIDRRDWPTYQEQCCQGSTGVWDDGYRGPSHCLVWDGDLALGRELSSMQVMQGVTEVTGDFELDFDDDATGVDFTGLADLATIGGNLAVEDGSGPVDLSALTSLTSVGGDLLLFGVHADSVVTLPALLSIGGWMRVSRFHAAELDFPALQAVDRITFGGSSGAQTVSLPALETVNSEVSISSNAGVEVIDLGSLQQSASLSIANNAALREINVGSASTVAHLWVQNNPELVLLDLGSLQTIYGRGEIVGNVGLPAVELPQLTTVTDELEIKGPIAGGAVTDTVLLPAFTSGGLEVSGLPAVTSLQLGQMTDGELEIRYVPLTSLGIPQLHTSDRLIVEDTQLTVWSAPALTTLATCSLQYNPRLSRCTLYHWFDSRGMSCVLGGSDLTGYPECSQ